MLSLFGRGRMRWAGPALALLTMLALDGCICQAWAQQSITTATLSGRIEDTNGAALNGVTLTVRNLESNQQLTTTTDEAGRYRLSYLPVGSYELTAEREGFAPTRRQLTLTIGQALEVPLTMTVAGVAASVSVTTAAPVIETARTQLAETITPSEIDDLPLNGRNYLDLALLVPGVSRTNTGAPQRFAETSAVQGTGLSIAGQRNLNNSFIVDGLSANDDAADLAGTFYSQEVIREFQVVTSVGIAEFGRASGGILNIITQTGTNKWRGRLYGFLRNQRFDARNPLASRRDQLTQAQYGITVGGPIHRDRTFLFANFEQTRRHDSSIITIAPADVAAINARLNAVGYPGPLIETGIVPGGLDATNLFARLDHSFGANLFNARFSSYDLDAGNARNVGGLNSLSRGASLFNRDRTLALGNVTTISARSVNEARFQFTHSRLRAPVTDTVGPAVNINGVASFGTATFSPLARSLDLYEAADNLSRLHGAHSLKAGADFLYNRVDVLFPGAVQGVYTFTSLPNFTRGAYSAFQQAFGARSQFQSNPNLGLFVQDEWKPRSDLTINAGMRYDVQWLPAPIETDANNFAPRLGLAFAPGNHRLVVRAGFGLYFDRLPLRATSNALQRDGSKYIVVQLSPAEAGAPVFPDALAAVPAVMTTRPNVTRIDPQIENSYSMQASLQVERELGSASSVAIGYLHLRGLHLILSRNVNVPTLTPAEAERLGIRNLGRPDPGFGNINRYESSGDSYYDALVCSLQQRFGRWANLRASYTLSKAIDDAGNFFFSSPQNNSDLRDERGPSDNDQRHRLILSGSFIMPPSRSRTSGLRRALQGFQLSYIFTYASALPFNILTGRDRNFDTNFNDRPPGVGRNSGRGFDFASLDMRLTRRFRFHERFALEAMAEGFNLLNRANLQSPNNVFGTESAPLPSFGRPTAAADPRQLQFGLRLDF